MAANVSQSYRSYFNKLTDEHDNTYHFSFGK